MPSIFISYSHKDEPWKDRLMTHLSVLEQAFELDVWEDRQIQAGDQWERDIETAMARADVALLLISAHFLTSAFIKGREVPTLLRRRADDGVRLVPIILRSCPWQRVDWLAPLQCLPRDGAPLTRFRGDNVDKQLTNIALAVSKLLDDKTPRADATAPIPVQSNAKTYLSRMPATGELLFGRDRALERLDEAWRDRATCLYSLVAWGGVGKTALANRWLDTLQRRGWAGAARVYAWSFYSQGTDPGTRASADEFLNHALDWFGDPDPAKGGPWEKGERLASLIRQQRTLLILDGLEPLQHPPGPGPMTGRLRDRGLEALLKDLARSLDGLCLICTRVAVADVAGVAAAKKRELEHLSPEAGAALLEALGVGGVDAERRQAAAEYGGHALALTLLGTYLAAVHGGDPRKRDRIPKLEVVPDRGEHARRVMQAYEKWLAGKPELAILRLLGLFDRPAETGAIASLRAEPPIAGLTDDLACLDEEKWAFALAPLRKLRLLVDEGGALDCHPLLREHFGALVEKETPEAWRAAHERLYEYYRALPEKEQPDTLEEMGPLFAAVAHGCRAGLHQRAMDEVYWARIQRHRDFYSTNKLGAFGADLAALAHFFDTPWRQPSPSLSEHDQAAALGWAGFRLRALGRLREAAEPMGAGMKAFEKNRDWQGAAGNAGNLSELWHTLGELGRAVETARQAVVFADRSEDWIEIRDNKTVLGEALNQAGELADAMALIEAAETLQQEYQPDYPRLYSLSGYQFCDLLLSQGRWRAALERAMQWFDWDVEKDSLLDLALANLMLGRAGWMGALAEDRRADLTTAAEKLDAAVAGLREAGTLDYLPCGLLARAACQRTMGDDAQAQRDLAEARELAERCEMKLFLTDVHLESARLALCCRDLDATPGAGADPDAARGHIDEAARLIAKTGYHRRDAELAALRQSV